jgi:hypothetical protein
MVAFATAQRSRRWRSLTDQKFEGALDRAPPGQSRPAPRGQGAPAPWGATPWSASDRGAHILPMPFIAPIFFIIFIRPPPRIFFIMSRICSY